MYHILTPFPELLNYSFYAPIILRIVLGLYSISLGVSQKIRISKDSAETSGATNTNDKKGINYLIKILLVASGLFIIVGFYTQIASLVLALLFILALVKRNWVVTDEISREELILLISIAVTLMFLGAGAFAIDYPL